MKNTQILLSVGALFSFAALRADLIETAIKDNDVNTITMIVAVGSTHNTTFAVTLDQKEAYKKLSEEQVLKAREKASASRFSFSSAAQGDLFQILATSLLVIKEGATVYENVYVKAPALKEDKTIDKHNWRTFAGSVAIIAGIGNFIAKCQDLVKHTTAPNVKAKEKLKDAQRIQLLIEALPITAPAA